MQTKALARYFEILKGKKKPRFQIAKRRGLLDKKIKSAFEILKSCELCERKCHVNRTNLEVGISLSLSLICLFAILKCASRDSNSSCKLGKLASYH